MAKKKMTSKKVGKKVAKKAGSPSATTTTTPSRSGRTTHAGRTPTVTPTTTPLRSGFLGGLKKVLYEKPIDFAVSHTKTAIGLGLVGLAAVLSPIEYFVRSSMGETLYDDKLDPTKSAVVRYEEGRVASMFSFRGYDPLNKMTIEDGNVTWTLIDSKRPVKIDWPNNNVPPELEKAELERVILKIEGEEPRTYERRDIGGSTVYSDQAEKAFTKGDVMYRENLPKIRDALRKEYVDDSKPFDDALN